MERCVFTAGTMMLGVSVVYLISLYERHKANKSEIDGIPTIGIYIRDYIGNGQLSLRDRIAAGKLRVVVPVDKKSTKISKPIPMD